jgi:hypothetical protein
MPDATNILETIAIGVQAWALLEIIALKTKVARLSQKLDDLPCQECPEPKHKAKLKLAVS